MNDASQPPPPGRTAAAAAVGGFVGAVAGVLAAGMLNGDGDAGQAAVQPADAPAQVQVAEQR